MKSALPTTCPASTGRKDENAKNTRVNDLAMVTQGSVKERLIWSTVQWGQTVDMKSYGNITATGGGRNGQVKRTDF